MDKYISCKHSSEKKSGVAINSTGQNNQSAKKMLKETETF